jgi:hypothetical protein
MNQPLRVTEAEQLSPGANGRHVRVRGDAGVLAGQAGQIRETVDLLSAASARGVGQVFSTPGTDKARALLAAAVSYTAGHHAPAVEEYPIDPAGTRVSNAFAYVGTTSTFEAAGVRQVTQAAAAHSARLPHWLMRRDLRA